MWICRPKFLWCDVTIPTYLLCDLVYSLVLVTTLSNKTARIWRWRKPAYQRRDEQFSCPAGIKSRRPQSWYFESQTHCEVVIYKHAVWGLRDTAVNLWAKFAFNFSFIILFVKILSRKTFTVTQIITQTNFKLGVKKCLRLIFSGQMKLEWTWLKFLSRTTCFWNLFITSLTGISLELVGVFNPLNAELNRIRHLLACFGAHHILHVSRMRVNALCKFYHTLFNCHLKIPSFPWGFYLTMKGYLKWVG